MTLLRLSVFNTPVQCNCCFTGPTHLASEQGWRKCRCSNSTNGFTKHSCQAQCSQAKPPSSSSAPAPVLWLLSGLPVAAVRHTAASLPRALQDILYALHPSLSKVGSQKTSGRRRSCALDKTCLWLHDLGKN